ncbi:MAG: YbjQ family protein [Candidatus Peribacteraceae bacterium]|nr:YbjQ family protein [Candidatus Peribacteraceae bacterium]
MGKPVLITTTETVTGREIIEVLGIVQGNTVQTRHIGSHILAGLMTIVGGEVKGYVKAFSGAREEATERMVANARALGADAVVGMRYTSSQIMNGGAEILAYGTAVKLR